MCVWEKNVFQNKNMHLVRWENVFTFLQMFLMPGSMENSWILTTPSASNLLQYIVRVKTYEENLSHTDVLLEIDYFSGFSK